MALSRNARTALLAGGGLVAILLAIKVSRAQATDSEAAVGGDGGGNGVGVDLFDPFAPGLGDGGPAPDLVGEQFGGPFEPSPFAGGDGSQEAAIGSEPGFGERFFGALTAPETLAFAGLFAAPSIFRGAKRAITATPGAARRVGRVVGNVRNPFRAAATTPSIAGRIVTPPRAPAPPRLGPLATATTTTRPVQLRERFTSARAPFAPRVAPTLGQRGATVLSRARPVLGRVGPVALATVAALDVGVPAVRTGTALARFATTSGQERAQARREVRTQSAATVRGGTSVLTLGLAEVDPERGFRVSQGPTTKFIRDVGGTVGSQVGRAGSAIGSLFGG